MSEIIICGDIQARSESPFYEAVESFFDWFSHNKFNNSNNIGIFLGDLLQEAKSNGKVNSAIVNFFTYQLKFKKIYVLQGNHDYSKREGSGILPIDRKNLYIIDTPTEMEIEGKWYLFLPYFYPGYKDLTTMKEVYESWPSQKTYECIFYHFDDETISFGGKTKGINISHIPCKKKVGGHIHKKQGDYLGSPLIQRYDEKGKKSYIIRWVENKEEYIEVPKFLDYYTIDYNTGEILNETKESPTYRIFDIINAPSRELAEEKYPLLKIRKITTINKFSTAASDSEKKGKTGKKSIPEYFSEFVSLNKVEPELTNMLLEVMGNAVI